MPTNGPPDSASLQIQPLDPLHHDRAAFSCGVDRMDNYLKRNAKNQQKDDFSRIYVATHPGDSQVCGYYALNAHKVTVDDFGPDAPSRTPRHGDIPALYISMIAVDGRAQRSGIGEALMMDALNLARVTADQIGLKAVILDVVDDHGHEAFRKRQEFYRRLGFQSFPSRADRMFLMMDTIRAMFAK